MTAHKHTFDWDKFKGGREALKWNMRDLQSIDQVLPLVPGRKACVQAGGNLGIFAKYLARFFQTVFTFEPDPGLFRRLNMNVAEANVVRIQAALGEAPGLIGMECRRRNPKPGAITHEGLTHVAGDGVIPRMRLDDFSFPTVDLLYLDLEGYELYALRGAAETIARCRPVIAVEINQNIEFYGFAKDDVRALLRAYDYRAVVRVQSDEFFVPCEMRGRQIDGPVLHAE